MRFKDRYTWIEKVEKLGPYKIRVTAKEVFATDLESFAYRFYIYDSKVQAKLENKADYGRVSAVATGPYKVVSLDAEKMVLERFDDYYDKDGPNRAPVKRVIVMPINIYQQISEQGNWQFGATVAVLLFSISLSAVYLLHRYTEKHIGGLV